MSGVFKSIGKVFKKAWNVVKKIAPYVIMAVAIYFTAGLALAYLPATSAFAASLPGFAGAAGAGTGIFSSVATTIGLGGGLQAGAIAAGGAGLAGAGTAAGAAALEGTVLSGAGVGGAAATGGIAAGGSAGALALDTASTAALAAGGTTAAAATGAAAAGGMTFVDKLLIAQMGTSAVAALTAPSPGEIASEQAKFRGSYYGVDESGKTSAAQPKFQVTQPGGPPSPAAPPVTPAPSTGGNTLYPAPPTVQPIDPNTSIAEQTQTPTQRIESLFPKGRSLFNG